MDFGTPENFEQLDNAAGDGNNSGDSDGAEEPENLFYYFINLLITILL